MNKEIIKQMQDLLKRIEKYEVSQKESKVSAKLKETYQEMDQKRANQAKIREKLEKQLEDLTVEQRTIYDQIVVEGDEDKKRELFDKLRKVKEERDFTEMNLKFRITPVLQQQSREIQDSDEYQIAYKEEWGRFSNEGLEMEKELNKLTKQIVEELEKEKNLHPFVGVLGGARKYSNIR